MNPFFNRSRLLVPFLFAAMCLCDISFAQDNSSPQPLFLAGRHPEIASKAGSANLTSWKGGFTDRTGVKRHFIMVGTDPATTNRTTIVSVEIIPIKLIYGPNNGKRTFDPLKDRLPDGRTVLQMVLASPIFKSNVDFVQGGTDIGKTQYIDAFQRANFWGKNVQKNNRYHVLLGKPTVLPEQTITVPESLGHVIVNPISHHGLIGTFDPDTMDSAIQDYIKKFDQIQPNTLPIFLTYDIYLGGPDMGSASTCGCELGYHFFNGKPITGQTYVYTTSVDQGKLEAGEDVSTLSHEVGEWMDDPFFGSNTVCPGGQLEVGDPLVHHPNFGTFPYKVGNFTYHLQSLVFLGYFGAPRKTDLHRWLSFQNDMHHEACPAQYNGNSLDSATPARSESQLFRLAHIE
jgi:hypothetical protein